MFSKLAAMGFAGALVMAVGSEVWAGPPARMPAGFPAGRPALAGGSAGHRNIFVPGMPTPRPDRMPGWDWWRTYPWSPYNYYNPNNPYSPYYNRYPYYQMPVYAPASGTTASRPAAPVITQAPAMPHPTGGQTVAPPDAGLIKVVLPDQFGTIRFDGKTASSMGYERTFVTPRVADGGTYSAEVSATFKSGSQQLTEKRQVNVAAGQTQVVDFGTAGGK